MRASRERGEERRGEERRGEEREERRGELTMSRPDRLPSCQQMGAIYNSDWRLLHAFVFQLSPPPNSHSPSHATHTHTLATTFFSLCFSLLSFSTTSPSSFAF